MDPTFSSVRFTSVKDNAATIAPEEFLTTQELMRLLKIKHKQTIYRLIDVGMPAVVVGKKNFRFIKGEVIAYLRQTSKKKRPQREL